MKVKREKKQNGTRNLTIKDFSLKNGKFLDEELIHPKGVNFLGNIFKN